ncbi:hypothetical protein OBE_05593, partial [human gut metagenome]
MHKVALLVDTAAGTDVVVNGLMATECRLNDRLSRHVGAQAHVGEHVDAHDEVAHAALVARKHHPANTIARDHVRLGKAAKGNAGQVGSERGNRDVLVAVHAQAVVDLIYKSDGESISPNNTLSEITYIDDDTFGNITLNEYLEQFLYHSGRTFSLGMMELDPELEIARVYYISNDGISYENNEKSEFKKPGRCLARICDIPTSFLQLIKIEGKAPTLVIDQDYVRSEVPFTSEDKENIWNNKNYRWVKFFNEVTNKTKLIFSEMDNLDSILNVEYLEKYYSRSIQLNES